MNKRMVSLITLLFLIILAGTLLASCGSSGSAAPASSGGSVSGGSASAGQSLMQDRCSVCHSLDRVTSAHKTAGAWKITVDRMISNGAQLTTQEEQTLINYLAQNYK